MLEEEERELNFRMENSRLRSAGGSGVWWGHGSSCFLSDDLVPKGH